MRPIHMRVADRLKRALDDSGLTAKEVQQQMGYTGSSTLDRWFRGHNRPLYEDIATFGAIVGKSFSWFFRVDEESEDQSVFMVDLLATVLWRLLNGEALADAIIGEVGEPGIVSPSVRRLMEEAEDRAREELVDLTGGWLDLPPAERRRRLRRLVNSLLDPDEI